MCPGATHIDGVDEANHLQLNSSEADSLQKVQEDSTKGPPEYQIETHQELCQIFHLAWPLSLSLMTNFAPRVVVLGLVGHLGEGGEQTVAAAGVGIMYCNMAGQMLLKSSAFGVTALFAQAYGAGNHRRVGHVLQRVLLMHLLTIVAITLPLTYYAHTIFLAAGKLICSTILNLPQNTPPLPLTLTEL